MHWATPIEWVGVGAALGDQHAGGGWTERKPALFSGTLERFLARFSVCATRFWILLPHTERLQPAPAKTRIRRVVCAMRFWILLLRTGRLEPAASRMRIQNVVCASHFRWWERRADLRVPSDAQLPSLLPSAQGLCGYGAPSGPVRHRASSVQRFRHRRRTHRIGRWAAPSLE